MCEKIWSGTKNTEFYADFRFVENITENACEKNYEQINSLS